MKIWKLGVLSDDYDQFEEVVGIDSDEIRTFDGRSKKDHWKPLKVRRVSLETGHELGDTPGFFLPVLSRRALKLLLPIIETEAEILPLDYEGTEFYAVNVTDVEDCIDYQNAEFRTYRDGKRIMVFTKYAFLDREVKGKNLFKIKDEPRRSPFVSDTFRNTVLENGLEGFRFELVWDSEA